MSTNDLSEPMQGACVTNRHGPKFNFWCCEMDGEGEKKKSMEKMRARESAGKENSNKVKKVLAHQSSRPAVGGDISLVHFVNREIVCRETGRVRVTRKDRDTQR